MIASADEASRPEGECIADIATHAARAIDDSSALEPGPPRLAEIGDVDDDGLSERLVSFAAYCGVGGNCRYNLYISNRGCTKYAGQISGDVSSVSEKTHNSLRDIKTRTTSGCAGKTGSTMTYQFDGAAYVESGRTQFDECEETAGQETESLLCAASKKNLSTYRDFRAQQSAGADADFYDRMIRLGEADVARHCGIESESSTGTSNSGEANSIDKGDFTVYYMPTVEYAELQGLYKQSRALESIAAMLNAEYALPFDVGLGFKQCNMANAFYDPNVRQVQICYELLDLMYERLSVTAPSRLHQNFVGALAFILFHEIGHALIRVWDLPITGREEDAADGVSAFILLNAPRSVEFMLGAASYWASDSGPVQQDHFSDTHSLSVQRFYNTLCWLYGADPVKNRALVSTPGMLPASRAPNCQYETHQLVSSWTKLLAPYIKSQ